MAPRIQMAPRASIRLTRDFAFLSAVTFIGAAALLGLLYRGWALNGLRVMAENHNVEVTRAFANSLWPDYAGFVETAGGLDAEALRAHPTTQALRRAVLATMDGLSVVKVKIYDLNGRTIFSTDPAQIGEDKSGNAGFVSARAGTVASELTYRDSFSAFEGVIEDRNVLSSYIPVQGAGPGSPVEGVVEIYSDVTPFLRQVEHTQWVQIAIVLATFALIYLALLGAVGRADRLLRRQHETHLELVANVARAESANQAKSAFLATISHELRTPLNAIVGFSEIIESEVNGPVGAPQYRDYAKQIRDSGLRLMTLINSILDFSEAETGLLELQIREVDPRSLAAGLVRTLSRQAKQAELVLLADIATDLPKLETDEVKLRQALSHLLTNAIKFTPPGGSVTLRLSADSAGEVAFAVQDTGIGIASADIPIALTPFGQADGSLARKYEGAGLGLPLAAKLVECLGGSLEIESVVGRGTTVTVRMPVMQGEHAGPPEAHPMARTG